MPCGAYKIAVESSKSLQEGLRRSPAIGQQRLLKRGTARTSSRTASMLKQGGWAPAQRAPRSSYHAPRRENAGRTRPSGRPVCAVWGCDISRGSSPPDRSPSSVSFFAGASRRPDVSRRAGSLLSRSRARAPGLGVGHAAAGLAALDAASAWQPRQGPVRRTRPAGETALPAWASTPASSTATSSLRRLLPLRLRRLAQQDRIGRPPRCPAAASPRWPSAIRPPARAPRKGDERPGGRSGSR